MIDDGFPVGRMYPVVVEAREIKSIYRALAARLASRAIDLRRSSLALVSGALQMDALRPADVLCIAPGDTGHV